MKGFATVPQLRGIPYSNPISHDTGAKQIDIGLAAPVNRLISFSSHKKWDRVSANDKSMENPLEVVTLLCGGGGVTGPRLVIIIL